MFGTLLAGLVGLGILGLVVYIIVKKIHRVDIPTQTISRKESRRGISRSGTVDGTVEDDKQISE